MQRSSCLVDSDVLGRRKMGDYLLLSWLCTRRGITVFLLLVLLTAAGNLYRLASERENANPPTV